MSAAAAQYARAALLALLAVAGLNGLFFAASLLAASATTGPPTRAVQQAFASGELTDSDYLTADWRRGWNQYNDCVVLQLVVNRQPSLVATALTPAFYVSDGGNPDVCRSLRRLASGDVHHSQLLEDRYGRYWHGYVPLAPALLRITDVGGARQGLRLLVVAALMLVTVVGWRTGGVLRTAAVSVGLTGLFFWGLPFYGQGLSYAPADAAVMFGIAAFIAWRRRLRNPPSLLLFSAGFGAIIAYLDFLTGPLPTAACLLFLFVYLASSEARAQGEQRSAWSQAFAAVAAFGGGAVLTVATKQVLVLALFGPEALSSFLGNLRLYLGGENGVSALTYVEAFVSLFKYTPLLTYYSIPAGAALLLASAVAWGTAAYLNYSSQAGRRTTHFAAHLIAASGIALWVLILPTHTALHGFMSRMLVVPLALGWSALALQLAARQPSARVPRPARNPIPRA